jgi:nitrogen-specific signal transduction histidine kinase
LTLALQIAQEHGGYIDLDRSFEGQSVFTIGLPKAALQMLGAAQDIKIFQVS